MRNYRPWISVLVTIVQIACSKNSSDPLPSPPAVTPAISFSKSTLSIGAIKGNKDSFTVQSNVNWKINVSPASSALWLKPSVTSGTSGSTNVILGVLDFNSASSQSATITVNASGDNKVLATLTITQIGFAFDNNKLYGGTSNDQARGMAKTPGNGLVIVGASSSTDNDVSINHGGGDFWVLNLDENGQKLWEKSFGGTADDNATCVAVTVDGGFVAAGATASIDQDISSSKGSTDYMVVKLDANGNKIWLKTFGGSGYDYATSIAATSDGGTIIAGYTGSYDGDVTVKHAYADYWVIKLNASGDIVWQKTFGGSGNEYAYSITKTSDNYFVIAGGTESSDGDITSLHGSTDIWVLKIDDNGSIIWQKTFGGTLNEAANSICSSAGGELFIAGYTFSSDGDITDTFQGMVDAWILKLDINGNEIWQKNLGGSSEEQIYSCVASADGGLFLTGYSYSGDGDVSGIHGDTDAWILKMDGDGSYEWQKMFGGGLFDYGYAITTTDEGYAVTGMTNSNDGDMFNSHGGTDVWVVKFK